MAIYNPALLDTLEGLPAGAWQGQVWRHMFNDHSPNRVNTSGARWNPAGVGAIYTATDRDTALAEGQRAIDAQPHRIYARRVLYEIDVSVAQLVDLTGPGTLAAVGLTSEDIHDDDHTACQRVGGAAAWIERDGLLVPSARAAGDNLVILVGPVGLDDDLVVLHREVIEDNTGS